MIISKDYEALRERARLLGEVFSLLLTRAALLARRYNPSQPRAPAGQPNGGQWVSEGGGSAGAGDADILLAGGIDEADKKLSVQQFVSRNSAARIHEVLPGEFLDLSITEVESLADRGNARARRCMKLLSRGRFRK